MSVVSLASKVDNALIVSALERWLEWARTGEVTSIAIAGVVTGRRVRMSRVVGETGLEQMALSGCLHDLARDIGAEGQRDV